MTATASIRTTLDAVTGMISARAGLVFPPSRRRDVEIATKKIMGAAALPDPGEWLGHLEQDAALLDELISELTIKETYFFREPGHFALIRDGIVRELQQRRGAAHTLRVWSAGCASGEEAYSLAILFEEMGLAGSVRILATDISRTALARARQATYTPWALRGEGDRLIGPYLRRSGDRFELAARFLRRVEFACLNLAQDVYPTFATNTFGLDLILCRNVLIYFDATTIRHVARRFYDSLADGGFLITSAADPSLANYAPYEVEMTSAGVIYRKNQQPQTRTAPLSPAVRLDFPASQPTLPPVPVAPDIVAAAKTRRSPPADPLAEARQAFERGENARVIELAAPFKPDVAAVILSIRALANLGDAEAAVAMAANAAARHPSSPEIGFLHAVLLMNLARYGEADVALRRVLYLDRSLAVAHFTHGATLRRLGDLGRSLQAYRNARDLAACRPAEEIVPLSDGEKAGRLAEAAAAQAALLEPAK